MQAWTWEELAAATLGRQFPRIRGRGEDSVVELVRRVGPIQSQAARAPFLCLASRLPGATYDDITAAHISMRVVRSTSLRGTVHTSTREQHAALSAVAMRTLAPQLRRLLRLRDDQIAAFRRVLEGLSADDWMEHGVLLAEILAWFEAQGLRESIAAMEIAGPRYALRGHPPMLRRPRSAGAGWESQAEVVYRAAIHAIDERSMDAQPALVELVRHHVRASGPVTRRDLAWWSGSGLNQVDEALASLAAELVVRPGPSGLDYLDLAGSPRSLGVDPGPRLLPEYDALLLAYDPKARKRFADDEAVLHSWNRANGVHSPTVLLNGRLRGRWRLTRTGNTGVIEVEMFPGERLVDPGLLADPAEALGKALALTVTDVRVASVSG